jgi:hypothetical protein
MKVEMGKKYTSGGELVRILCTDRDDKDYPVIGIFFKNSSIGYFSENGESIISKDFNLEEIWKPTLKEWCLFWCMKIKSMLFNTDL